MSFKGRCSLLNRFYTRGLTTHLEILEKLNKFQYFYPHGVPQKFGTMVLVKCFRPQMFIQSRLELKSILSSRKLSHPSTDLSSHGSDCANPSSSANIASEQPGNMMSLVYPDGRVRCIDLQQKFS